MVGKSTSKSSAQAETEKDPVAQILPLTDAEIARTELKEKIRRATYDHAQKDLKRKQAVLDFEDELQSLIDEHIDGIVTVPVVVDQRVRIIVRRKIVQTCYHYRAKIYEIRLILPVSKEPWFTEGYRRYKEYERARNTVHKKAKP